MSSRKYLLYWNIQLIIFSKSEKKFPTWISLFFFIYVFEKKMQIHHKIALKITR